MKLRLTQTVIQEQNSSKGIIKCVYQGARNVSFSENRGYVTKWMTSKNFQGGDDVALIKFPEC